MNYMNYLKHHKKSQITMFVILGLVLLIIVIIILAMRQSIKPRFLTAEDILNELETGRVKNHITDCAVRVVMDGLEKIGANGGMIYDFEGGTIPFRDLTQGFDYLDYTYLQKTYFVTYGLKENTLCSQVNYKTPDYPYTGTSLSKIDEIYNSNCLFSSFYAAYDGFYGESVMNKLCHLLRASGCEPFAQGVDVGFTIQKQLEDYVAQKLPLCINLTQFSDKMGAELSAEAPPTAELNIHDSDILLAIKYPIKITYPDQEPITRIMDYQATLNVRLGRLYNFIYNLLSYDSKKIDFSIEEEFTSSPYWKNGLEVQRARDPCAQCSLPYKYDDVLTVIDRKSIVNGRPLLFRVAIKDRRPALDKIEEVLVDVNEISEINLPLRAYDPDDSKIKYFFLSFGPLTASGWREKDEYIKNNLQNSILNFPITRMDSGNHEVSILALDDNGLFDYQNFSIKIIDKITDNSPDTACIENCVLEACWNYAKGINQDCIDYCSKKECDHEGCKFSEFSFKDNPWKDCRDAWCKTAANQCSSKCGNDMYVGWACFPRGDDQNKRDCQNCVFPIVHAGDPQPHIDCITVTDKAKCISYMPDCFWVKENDTLTNTFKESCYNDITLNQVQQPAYIITK